LAGNAGGPAAAGLHHAPNALLHHHANHQDRSLTQADTEARALKKSLAEFQQPSGVRSVLEIVLSAAPLAVLWTAGWFAISAGLWWLALLISIPSSFFVVRLFMIQHDCGHQAFFRSSAINNWVGRAVGVFTLTPYDCWKREHAIHHASSGNLDRRGPGAIATMTIDEYRAATPMARFWYRVYRHPLVLFCFGPAFVFFLQQRLPVGLMKEGWRPWVSAMGTNLVIAALVVAAIWFGGWQALVLLHLPTVAIAASIGVWLFYVQHQFETTHWDRNEEWEGAHAALMGSSHLVLPAPLRWLTANIGIHHVHHVASRIPFYRLPNVLKRYPHLNEVGRLTLADSVRCVGLTLWDEANRRLVSFRDARRMEQGLAIAA
jgi:acyl-lipid omega-6 desaturase (Delta-12 desaturase)